MREDVKAIVALAATVFEVAEPVVEIGSLQTEGQEGWSDLRDFLLGDLLTEPA